RSRAIRGPRVLANVNLAFPAHMNIERSPEWSEDRVNLRFILPLRVPAEFCLKDVEPDTVFERANEISESRQEKCAPKTFRKIISQECNPAGTGVRVKGINRFAAEAAI